ncbi:3-oxoacyl-[acyl-carrier protein] reductase [Halalkalibacter wakoensis JCM 9140]|uniref:3-oxoacyl-[acyl-carrier protein] reductase n=1 Tax=Halalkalibacter wakoensis JCM 9140 TaxID=1236970 RepID=W4Q4U9_9BACI|nr:3-oxoacyl-ACP reductase [Halalkalibacter wakoensis]GAE26960.1 3-oxoacyl-[acyl-carrier protein] reductase [Halalkalibacter wakoensis JCM 9140]
MDTQLQQKVVLITGSSRGIGAKIAEGFARQGATVVINYLRSKERAEELANYLMDTFDIDTMIVQGNVTCESDVEHMIDEVISEFDTIDIVVNNALHAYAFDPDQRKLAWELEWEDYQRQIDGSLKGTYNVTKHVIPYMKNKKSGRMINMISNLVYRPVVPYHDYNTAKGAVLTYSQNLAVDLGPFGITVNCIAPGLVYPTDASRTTKEEVKELIKSQTPLHRIAKPEDVVGSVLFFASGWSSFVTGQCIVVDGGFVMK